MGKQNKTKKKTIQNYIKRSQKKEKETPFCISRGKHSEKRKQEKNEKKGKNTREISVFNLFIISMAAVLTSFTMQRKKQLFILTFPFLLPFNPCELSRC